MTGLMFPKPTRKTRPKPRLKRRKTLGAVRAERKAEGPGVSEETWQAILRWYDWTCAFCGQPEKLDDRLVQDHVVALARGGAHAPENVVPCHASENIRKGIGHFEPLRMHPFSSEAAPSKAVA